MSDHLTPVISRPHLSGLGGTQDIYRFPNGFGASVVRFPFSYGAERGLFELAVIQFLSEDDGDYKLTYKTPVTDDVIGHLSETQVKENLKKIAALPADETK